MENVTNVEYYRLGQLNLSKYTLYLSLSFVSITVSVMAFVAICMFSKHTKHHILFEGFNFACAINSFAAIYQCFYSIHVQMIGVQQVSRRACALSALFNPLQIFSKSAITTTSLAISCERYVALIKPLQFRCMSPRCYVFAIIAIYLYSLGNVLVLYAWIFFDTSNVTVSSLCIQYEALPIALHYGHIVTLVFTICLSVVVYCTSISILQWRMRHSTSELFSAHRLKFDLLVTKRLALAAGNLAALMILPIILHFLLTASKSALQFMWLIWFPYDSSLVVAILLYCWYQKLLQQLVARFVHYVRSSKVSPGGCSQDMRSASNDHTHTRV